MMHSPIVLAMQLNAAWPGKRPLEVVDLLVAQHGLCIRKCVLEDELSGFLLRGLSRVYVVVNARHPWVRRNFTIAHELGHFLLDHPGGFCHGNLHRSRHPEEVDANRFAAALLMPASETRRMIEAGKSVQDVARRWGVSAEAARYRIDDLARQDLLPF